MTTDDRPVLKPRQLSRRTFIAGTIAGGLALAACGRQATPAATGATAITAAEAARPHRAYRHRVVDTAAEAIVVIEVLGRGEQASGDTNLRGGALGQVEQTSYKDKVVRVKLSFGDYSTEIEGRYADGANVIKTTWAGAAVEAAGQIDKWIKTNRAKLP